MQAGLILFPILSPLVSERVFPLVAPETADNAPPYIIYTPISAVPEQTFDGHTGDEWVRVQVDIYHTDYDELLALHSQVIKALDTLGLKVFSSSSQSFADGLFRASLDVEFWQTL